MARKHFGVLDFLNQALTQATSTIAVLIHHVYLDMGHCTVRDGCNATIVDEQTPTAVEDF